MFIVILTVVALADYLITFCCIVNMVSKAAVMTEETSKVIYDGKDGEADQPIDCFVTDFVCEDNEFDLGEGFDRYIEEQNSRIALLSLNVNKILSNIDAIIQEKK